MTRHKKIAIHGHKVKPEATKDIQNFLSILRKRGCHPTISETFGKENEHHFQLEGICRYKCKINQDIDLMVCIGGDGTLLEAVTHVGASGVPILGINTGRLGFLATTSKGNIQTAIDQVLEGRHSTEERTLVELETSEDIFKGFNYALNEFAIIRKDSSSMITIHAYLGETYINTYWADGLMVSTPTGSTGYSLSCGGPIVLPDTNNFIITPVSPHNLNIRPLVIPNSSELTFKIDSRDTNVLVSLDSRSATVSSETKLRIKKADFKIKLINLKNSSYLETLRSKLGWGFDKRN